MQPAQHPGTLAAILIFSMTAAGCAGIALPGTPTLAPQPTSTPTDPLATQPVSATVLPSTTPEGACPPLNSNLLDEMRAIESEVADLRGLSPQTGMQRELLDPQLLRERIEDDVLQEYGEEAAVNDSLLYSLLGFVQPGLDLRQLYAALLAEQAAGFYDPETDEMVIVCGGGFGGIERLTYVHEYTHVLVDQVYDPRTTLGYSQPGCQEDIDRCRAIQALIEGDASLLEEQWLRTFGRQQDLTDILAFFDRIEMPAYDSAPGYIQAEMMFPYLQGLAFVRAIYLQDGWAGVDALYQNPPLSSEQILHPERFPRDAPVQLPPPDMEETLGVGWTEVENGTFGEWNTYMLLLEQLEQDAAQGAAEGWGGDFLLAFQKEDSGEGALLLLTQWDTIRDAREFVEAFRSYGTARFGEPSADSASGLEWNADEPKVLFLRQSNQTLWILAPDIETRNAIRDAIRLPVWPTP